jgi:hypothetical protein
VSVDNFDCAAGSSRDVDGPVEDHRKSVVHTERDIEAIAGCY